MFKNSELLDEMEKLRRFAYKLCQNQHDAEDLLQSTILRAIEKKHLFKKDTNLFSWSSKIMYNLFVSAYRRKTKFETQYDPEPYLERESVKSTQEKKMEVRDIEDAMAHLGDDHREILYMICVNGMPYADVSKKLRIPLGTVRSRLSRARESLVAAMKKPKYAANTNIAETVKAA